MLKRKRTQAFTAPKDKRTKIIVQKNASSPLFHQLPKEIRDKIFGYLAGSQTIHIHFNPVTDWEPYGDRTKRGPPFYEKHGRFEYVVCRAEISEKAAYEKSRCKDYDEAHEIIKDFRLDNGDVRRSRDRHHSCYAQFTDESAQGRSMHNGNKPLSNPSQGFPIHALRVCRQMYVELNELIWSTTTWSFTHALSFSQFMEKRNLIQRRFMRKIHLDLDPFYSWVDTQWLDAWYGTLHKKVLCKFKNIEVLHLDIRGNQLGSNLPLWPRIRPLSLVPNVHMTELADLQFLPLKEVTIICIDTCTRVKPGCNRRMNHAERLEMADAIRARLLDYQGRKEPERRKKEILEGYENRRVF